VRCDVAASHILNRLELAVHLTNASKRDSGASVELAILNKDVGRVCFWRNGVVTVIYNPTTKSDVVGIDSVARVGILIDSKTRSVLRSKIWNNI
jgi:hypothetical protein